MGSSSVDSGEQINDWARQAVDTLNAIFGVHPGYRAAHAKGIVCDGVFTPSTGASALSRAPHFQRDPVSVTVRFSDSSGDPNLPSGDPNAAQRGLAIKFHLPGGVQTDLIAHSYNGFPVGTPEDFLALFKAVAASGPGTPSPTLLEQFAASHPLARKILADTKPAPVSYATLPYYAIHAFRFVDRNGRGQYGRYRLRPLAGEAYLDPANAARRVPNYLFDELRARLGNGPAQFRLILQLAGEGDPTNDASLAWPEDRPQAELGTLAVTAIVADSDAAQRKIIFDPTRVVDGIELSGDPLLPLRHAAYSISYDRRNPQ